jgi:hypothetical protein
MGRKGFTLEEAMNKWDVKKGEIDYRSGTPTGGRSEWVNRLTLQTLPVRKGPFAKPAKRRRIK